MPFCRILSAILLLALRFSPSAAIPPPDSLRLARIVETLASPRFEGRLLGSPGNLLARNWILERAEEQGLRPLEGSESPVQSFQVDGYRWKGLTAGLSGPADARFELIMKSDGPTPSSFGPLRIWDPLRKAPACDQGEILARLFNPATGDSPSDLLDEAAEVGAGALILLPDPADSMAIFDHYRRRYAAGDRNVQFLHGAKIRPLLFFGTAGLRKALAATDDLQAWRLSLPASESLSKEGGNLIFRAPGSGPGPVVLLVAHYDHLGSTKDGYYPGANDNGSGVAVLLETARITADRRYPFALRFLFSDGEEEGALGARAYLEALEAPALVINLDTVGRAGVDNYRKLRDRSAFSSDLLMVWSGAAGAAGADAAKLMRLASRLGFETESGEGPIFERAGDHFPFSRAGVPSLFLFGGFHPDYHEPGDTPDKVLPGKLARICDLLDLFLVKTAANPMFLPSAPQSSSPLNR